MNKSPLERKESRLNLWNGLIWQIIRKNDRCTEQGNGKHVQ